MSCFLLISGEVEGYVGGWWLGSGWMPFRRQIEESITSSPHLHSDKDRTDAASAYVRALLHLQPLRKSDRSRDEMRRAGEGNGRKERVYIQHGRQDRKMLLEWGLQMGDVLRMIGCEVAMDVYEMGHWWCEESLAGLGRWIEDILEGGEQE